MPKHGKQGNSKKETKYISPEKALHIILKSPSREECLKLEEKLKQTPNSMSRECVLKCLDVKVDILALLEHNMNQVTTTDQIEKLNKKAELIDDKIKKIHAKSNELTDDLKREINTFKNKRLSEVETFKKELRQKENSLKETAQKKELQQKSNTNDVTSQIQPTEEEAGAKQKNKEKFEKRIERQKEKGERKKEEMEKEKFKKQQEKLMKEEREKVKQEIDKSINIISIGEMLHVRENCGKDAAKNLTQKTGIDIEKIYHYSVEPFPNVEAFYKLTAQTAEYASKILKKEDEQNTMITEGSKPNSEVKDCTCEGACACNTKSHQ